ncbi:DNA-3-methyladenine glycosidase Mag2 [Schizosaccharomyces cryophilus OY26]|uniref:DNA-3-methyladenine glycosidase Mag2 n=1 Tax=Schizosaccharomyces cryophilus (strain OY26 / ATCC MYA-4695 / CBS 11777 / NBRC 106824 / NRRL Y48691) TaxID=653667 RepID=S9WXZ7_SCHCR|nr:DNA-3-methyladenine glycosidase Mag2 [Schizosaccharomyces cryophilus OY26]EPY49602.1 DNA-3-methyladenine glycosidase Mag2 [Schizosaccharomyces cryophilus OY26]
MPQTYKQAEHHISKINSTWDKIVSTVGPCTLQPHPDRQPYEGLIRAITSQKLSSAATEAIIHRLCELYNQTTFPTPQQIVDTDVEKLHSCGFSKLKAEAVHNIADAAIKKTLPSNDTIAHMSNQDLFDTLSKHKSVKRWTIEMYMIFTLGRLDVMPADDATLRSQISHIFGLDSKPTVQDIEQLTAPCAPYQTIAAWYLWHYPKH